MTIFSYRATGKDGRRQKGLLRAEGISKAKELLAREGFSGAEVRPYCEPPDAMALLVFSVFMAFIIFALIALFSDKEKNSPIIPIVIALVFIAAMLVIFFRMYLKQTLPARTKAHLDTGEEKDAYLLGDIVSGEFIPEKEEKQVIVEENGIKKQKVLSGKIERSGLPDYLHILICLAGYYIPAVIIWKTLSPAERTASGNIIPAWELALGLSLFIVPVLLVTLSIKLRRDIVFTCAAIAAACQYLLLRSSYAQNPKTAMVYEILSSHPAHVLAAWLIPSLAMMFLEQNKKIKDIIKLEYPIYE